MKAFIILLIGLLSAAAQGRTDIEERIEVSGETRLVLDFPFADDIRLETWDRNEVLVQAAVTINDGEQDDLFELEARKSAGTIYIEMDKDGWKHFSWDGMCHCRETKIDYQVYFPGSMSITAETISGGFVLDYYGLPARLKTISGDIDLNVPDDNGVDFNVKTISGEVYSDLDIDYPYGRDGLSQLVGISVRGRAFGGGSLLSMETISGDIYLRRKE